MFCNNGRDSLQLFVGVFDTCLVWYLLVLPSESQAVANMTSSKTIDGSTNYHSRESVSLQVSVGGGGGERVRDEHARAGGGARGAQGAPQPRHLLGKGRQRHGLGRMSMSLAHIFALRLHWLKINLPLQNSKRCNVGCVILHRRYLTQPETHRYGHSFITSHRI